MDSSRPRSRATPEEERAGHGGRHRTGPDERYQNITKQNKKKKKQKKERKKKKKRTFCFIFFLNVHIPQEKIYPKDPELERPEEDGRSTERGTGC